MAKKKPQKKRAKKRELEEDDGEDDGFLSHLKDETKQGVLIVVLVALTLFFLLSAFDLAGVVGEFTYTRLTDVLGIGFFLVPLLALLLIGALVRGLHKAFTPIRITGALVFFVAGLAFIDLTFSGRGGMVGHAISTPLTDLFDVYASVVFLVALIAIAVAVLLDIKVVPTSLSFFARRNGHVDEGEGGDAEAVVLTKEQIADEEYHEGEGAGEYETPENETPALERDVAAGPQTPKRPLLPTAFTPPPLSLLEKDRGKPGVGDIKANANIIKRTLQNFGINVEMDEVSIGPSVTRYALKPAEGVKLSRIVGLKNDLALSLAAHPIRIEAPIPGKSLVGIEIPNSSKTTVGLGTLLGSADFQSSEKPLLVSLGKSIAGKSHFANVAKMPHLLIAGATGSGKSVTIHTLITSLLFRNGPEGMRFIMIDPKRVELTLYNKIPHLLTPVITGAKQSILALKWAAKEMGRRYDILEAEAVRDIQSYHKNIVAPAYESAAKSKTPPEDLELPERLPYIVIVIDELADIMQAYPRELESAIVRLAQMSRAVGIHLVLSTQRPSVNIITGLIKANIPARIALQVSSQVDSRTILDMSGAETLLGAGDMLYLSGEMSKPQRIQSAFISEIEVKKVVAHLTRHYADWSPDAVSITEEAGAAEKNSLFDAVMDESGENDDDLYEEARDIVVGAGKASTSYLQRKLRVGYARAARLMDMLEERGVIGPAEGSKPRRVLEGGHDPTEFSDDRESRDEKSETPL